MSYDDLEHKPNAGGLWLFLLCFIALAGIIIFSNAAPSDIEIQDNYLNCKLLTEQSHIPAVHYCQFYLKFSPNATGQEIMDYYNDCHEKETHRLANAEANLPDNSYHACLNVHDTQNNSITELKIAHN